MDDEAVLSKCCNIMAFFDKLEKEISGDSSSGNIIPVSASLISWTYIA